MRPGPAAPRWRAVGVGVAAFVLVDALIAAAFSFWPRPPRAAPEQSERAQPASTARAAPLERSPIVLARSAGAPSTGSGAPRRRLLPTDPDPVPSVTYKAASTEARDPFVGGADGPSVRVLASHGSIRVGVSKSSSVRDEARVTEILGELAAELDSRESGRKDDYEARAHDYQPVLGRYAERLGEHMSGDIAFHAGDWILYQSVHAGGSDHAHP